MFIEELLSLLKSWDAWPADICFTSLQINSGKTSWHMDGPNIGLSIGVACGDFAGGRLEFEDELVDIRWNPYVFDGKRWHQTEDFSGERFAMVAFVHCLAWKLPSDDIETLESMGFSLPKMSHLKSLHLNIPVSPGSSEDEEVLADMDVVVPRGLGAPKGLTMLEHIEWAKTQTSPLLNDSRRTLDMDVSAAIAFECDHDPGLVDAFTLEKLLELRRLASEASKLQDQWLVDNELSHNPLARTIAGPLFASLIVVSDYEDKDGGLAADIAGFALVGILPSSGPETEPSFPNISESISVEELKARRLELNTLVVNSIRESEFDFDLYSIAEDEDAIGVASGPSVVTDDDWFDLSFCRRLAVREERSAGWRTRPVDHMTENMANPATLVVDRTLYDSIEPLVNILLEYMRRGMVPEMWKRDIEKAFRKLLVTSCHRQFAVSVWKFMNKLWKLEHFWHALWGGQRKFGLAQGWVIH